MFITANSVKAVEVKCFFPPKNLQISIDITGFEPDYSIDGVTILSGNANGMQITILAADANGRNAVQDRERYGLKRADSTGDKTTIKLFDINDFNCLKYKWKNNNSDSLLNNTWGYFTFYVKDGIAINLLLTADITKHSEDEFINIIKSLKITPTEELKDLNNILNIMEARLENSSDKENEFAKRIKKGQEYLIKHPDSQEVLYRLGDYYTGRNQLEHGRSYYLKALESAKTTMPLSPETIWIIQVGL
jgi:tetratricopeptide (TPR) repeat protein